MKRRKLLKRWFYTQRDRLLANWAKRQEPALKEPLHTYTLFVGHPRSSHTVIGSLIDAHPHAAIGNEQDTLKYIHAGFSREQLYTLVARNARITGKQGRSRTGYSYVVPGQWQGQWQQLQVIGDKRGGNTSRWLYWYPHLLQTLMERLPEQVRLIYISRNPFDNIATMVYRHAQTHRKSLSADLIEKERRNYLAQAQVVEQVRQQLGSAQFYHVAIEDFLQNPEHHLRQLLHFLGLTPYADYLEACKAILYESPRQSRWRVEWPEGMVQEITQTINELPCLKGYRFHH